MEKPKHKPEHALMEAIGFTEDDLEANQEGRLSQEQYRRLARQSRTMMWVIILLSLVTLPVSCLFTVAHLGMSDTGVFIFVGLMAFGLAVVLTLKWGSKNRDYHDATVRSVEGRVGLDVGSSGDASTFIVRVEDQKFKVNKRTFLAFKNGDPYAIYFMPSSKTIISAEWLRD
jgi:hypothetical protein